MGIVIVGLSSIVKDKKSSDSIGRVVNANEAIRRL
jgi:hypothetical protein